MINDLKEYQKKVKFLRSNNKYYYELNNPKITDAEYDFLKKEILNFEKKNNINIISKEIGYKPSKKFSKVKHSEKMLSLDNAFNL